MKHREIRVRIDGGEPVTLARWLRMPTPDEASAEFKASAEFVAPEPGGGWRALTADEIVRAMESVQRGIRRRQLVLAQRRVEQGR